MRPLIDAHLDLAMNAIYYDRDITLDLDLVNQQEVLLDDLSFRSRATTTLPELRAANVPVCIATFLARSGPGFKFDGKCKRSDIDHGLRESAYCSCYSQLAYYELLERRGEIRILKTLEDLEEHLLMWNDLDDVSSAPIGVILSMEGADPILQPVDVEYWYDIGLRALGLTHYGYSHYGAGTRVEGPLTDAGREILPHLERLGIVVDLTHLSDESMAEVFDSYTGLLWASHHNCRALVPGDRQLADFQIKAIAARGGVIGMAFDAIMLHPDWVYRHSDPSVLNVRIANVADHIDHIAQLTGTINCIGIGTDLDGGFGTEQTPVDLQQYRDIRILETILSDRGYADAQIDAIFSGNWLRMFRQSLPARERFIPMPSEIEILAAASTARRSNGWAKPQVTT